MVLDLSEWSPGLEGRLLLGPAARSRPPGLRHQAQPTALWKLEAVPPAAFPRARLPSPEPGRAVPPSRAVGQGRTQLWRRCDTHGFNCTYTKEEGAVGLLGKGSRGCC